MSDVTSVASDATGWFLVQLMKPFNIGLALFEGIYDKLDYASKLKTELRMEQAGRIEDADAT